MIQAQRYLLLALLSLSTALSTNAAGSLFNVAEMYDASTLEVSVIKDWHTVDGEWPTRQKVIEITVGKATPDTDYRVLVQFAVPVDRKAQGFYLTSGVSKMDMKVRGFEGELIHAGVGLVKTRIKNLEKDLKQSRDTLFYETLDLRYRNFWIWPATYMRAITAAYAEDEHFETGNILVSGASKGGETSAITLIHDTRVTAAFGSVCPIYASPVRLSDPDALAKLDSYNQALTTKKPKSRGWLGGLAGPSMKAGAFAEGHSEQDLQNFAEELADQLFMSRNVDMLKARGAEFLFHPGTHDMVSYDGIWGGMNAADIPVYNAANSGHGKKVHPANLKQANKAAFILNHFIGGAEPMLEPPLISTKVSGDKLEVRVTFKPGSPANSGRVFWIFDRGPDASPAYLEDLIPDENWKDMTYDQTSGAWTVGIDLNTNASHIDVFSNHQKAVSIDGKEYTTALSSPYTRVALSSQSLTD